MERQMKYAESLKEMVLRRVVVQLWNDSDVLTSLSSFCFFENLKVEKEEKQLREIIEPKIKDKVLTLILPESLTKQMIEMVRPIGLQIKRWHGRQNYHLRNEEMILPDSTKLCWTAAGLIDYRKTAKELVYCDDLDVVLRYKLACMNCLEDDIPRLWEKLSEEKKVYFCNKVRKQKDRSPRLHFCWPHILKGELLNLDYVWKRRDERNLTSFHQWAFEEAADKGNKIATEYFYQKLTREEKETSLTRTFIAVHKKLSGCITAIDELAEVFFYLLSAMAPEQGMEIFWSQQSNILVHFLHWPDLLLENIHLYWRLIPPFGYLGLEYEMRYALEQPELPFWKMFPEFFEQSPLDFKRHLIDRGFMSRFLSMFFDSGDSAPIEAIFRNLSAGDTERLVFQPRLLKLFFDSILQGKWNMVQVCLREAMLSEKDKKRLKEAFLEVRESRGNGESVNKKFERYFKYLGYATAYEGKKAKKRKLENYLPE